MSDLGNQVRKEIGGHLRRLRISLGWTLADVAAKASLDGISVSASTVSRVERGITAIPAEALSGLCRSLGTSLSYVEEIVRTAANREQVDLTAWDDHQLLAKAQEHARAGEVSLALVHLGAAHDWLLMQQDLEDADERLATVLTWEAACYRRMHSFTMALNTAGRVLNMNGISVDAKLHAVALHIEVGYITGDFYRASVFAAHAESLLESVTDSTRARAEMVLGMLEFEQECFEEAVPRLEAARALYKSLDRTIEFARSQVTLGYCHHRLGRPQGGRRLVLEGQSLAHKNGFDEVLAYALRTEGRILVDLGDLTAAEEVLGRAGDLARKLGLATQEFGAWFALYQGVRAAGIEDKRVRLARRLERLLRRVTHQAPEVQQFLTMESINQVHERRKIS